MSAAKRQTTHPRLKRAVAVAAGVVAAAMLAAIVALRSSGAANAAGFFGTRATLLADINLTAALVLLAGLIVGWASAKLKRFTAHQYIQTSMVLLFLVLIAFIMAVSYVQQVQPGIPARLLRAYYATSAAHSTLGAIAEVCGLFLVLRMNRLVPKALRIRWWKNLMRLTMLLFVVVGGLGVGTYYVWYVAPAAGTGAVEVRPVEVAEAASVRAPIANFVFNPPDLVIPVGTSVEWVNQDAAPHTVTFDDFSVDSGQMNEGDTFEITFNQVGAIPYFCAFHGSPGGQGMAARIVVAPAGQVAGVPTEVAHILPTPAPTPEAPPASYFGEQAVGLGVFRDANARLDEFRIQVTGLSAPEAGESLQAILSGEAGALDLGPLVPDASGDAVLQYVDPEGFNLLAGYSAYQIVRQPTGEVVFGGQVPAGPLAEIRNLLVRFPETPDQRALVPGVVALADEFYRHVDAALASAQAGDLTSVRRHAEHMVIVLTGEGQDLDGDGVFFTYNGFGLLRFAELTSTHARSATQAQDANDNVVFHGIHVINSAEDVLTWGGQALELARGTAGVTDAAAAQAQTAELLRLADLMLNGVDEDGDGMIAPIPGEAGAYTALHHAQFMTAMGVVTEE